MKAHQTDGSVTADGRSDESDGEVERCGDERRGEWVREGHQIQMKTVINKVHYRHPAGFQLKQMETACNKKINI